MGVAPLVAPAVACWGAGLNDADGVGAATLAGGGCMAGGVYIAGVGMGDVCEKTLLGIVD